MEVLQSLLSHELTIGERLNFLYAFILVGLVIAVQISQLPESSPIPWAKVTDRSRLVWYSVYVLEVFLLVQSAYPILLHEMTTSGYAFGHEEQLLNGIWIGLLGIETLMVLGVAVQSIVRRVRAQSEFPKKKLT